MHIKKNKRVKLIKQNVARVYYNPNPVHTKVTERRDGLSNPQPSLISVWYAM